MDRYALQNIVKTILFTLLILTIFAGVVYLVLNLNPAYAKFALFYAILSSLFYVFIGLLLGPRVVLWSVGARPLEEHPRYGEVKEIVERLAKKAKIPTPKLYYFPAEDINAFATGFTPSNAAIAITTGALKHLDHEELSGVLGHEIAHIKHYDTLQMTVVSVLSGIISYVANYLIFYVFYDDEKPAWVHVLAIITSLLTPFIVFLIQLAISREREYHADYTSAKLNGSPWGLINAFKKIIRVNHEDIPKIEALEPLYFVSVEELFSTHPPIEKRIKRLLEAFGEA